MQQILSNPTLIYVLFGVFGLMILALIAVVLGQNKQNKLQDELTLLQEEKETLIMAQNQTEQEAIQLKADLNYAHLRLQEYHEQMKQNQQKSQQDLAENQRLNQVIQQLTGELGNASSKAESLQTQLNEKQAELRTSQRVVENLQQRNNLIQNELTELKVSLDEKTAHFLEQQRDFEATKVQLKTEFQNLANQILEEKAKSFDQSNQMAMDNLLKPFREQIEGFQKRVNEIHSESVKGNAGIEVEIRKMLELGLKMNKEASNLTSALKGNKKVLGNWGELQLEQTLQMAGLEANVHYVAQEYFKNEEGKKQYPDFVLHLPDDKHIIIDSKMSLVAYENAVNAENDALRQGFLNEHCQALRNHIDDLSKKNYSALKGLDSPNFVLMFIALEPAYIEALRNDPALFNYGYQKNVVLVSHTTLMPILRTVANLWRLEQSNKEAIEISQQAGDLYNQLCTVTERLRKLGNTLSSANAQYNDTVVAFAGKQGIIGKAERFQKLSNRANKEMPELGHIQQDVEKIALLE